MVARSLSFSSSLYAGRRLGGGFCACAYPHLAASSFRLLISAFGRKTPHPNPPPEYRGREPELHPEPFAEYRGGTRVGSIASSGVDSARRFTIMPCPNLQLRQEKTMDRTLIIFKPDAVQRGL